MTEGDQEKLLQAGAAFSGSLLQFNFIKEKLKISKAILVFATGIICGLYGGPYIASLVPGCSRELMFLIIVSTAFLGKSIIEVILQGVQRRGPGVVDAGADFIEERIIHPNKDHAKREKEREDEEVKDPEEVK